MGLDINNGSGFQTLPITFTNMCNKKKLDKIKAMLIAVESMLAAAGGLGFLIKNSDKMGNQGRVIALQIIILLIGVFLDFVLTKGRQLIFRYSKI